MFPEKKVLCTNCETRHISPLLEVYTAYYLTLSYCRHQVIWTNINVVQIYHSKLG